MGRKNGLKSTPIAALRYQKHAIQAPPAIYQTVSYNEFSEVRSRLEKRSTKDAYPSKFIADSFKIHRLLFE